MKVIFFLVFSLISLYIDFKIKGPVLCDTLSHVEKLQTGIIPRTPLLQPGQTIRNLAHGIYNVTVGTVTISYLGDGHVTKVIGIAAIGDTGLIYVPGTQPFNSYFASILFELREAGQQNVSHSALGYTLSDNR